MSEVFPESPLSSPPATVTPGQADEVTGPVLYQAYADGIRAQIRAGSDVGAVIASTPPYEELRWDQQAGWNGVVVKTLQIARAWDWTAQVSELRRQLAQAIADRSHLEARATALAEAPRKAEPEPPPAAAPELAAALETVDALDADNARLTAECAALTGQLAVMTAARDDLARELDKALKEQDRYRAALEAIRDHHQLGRSVAMNVAREALEGGHDT